jgi:hypothetical protein
MTDPLKVHCNGCGRDTNHATRTSFTYTDTSYEFEYKEELEVSITFEILQCLGCNQLCVRETGEHEAYGAAVPQFYPPRIARRRPRWWTQLPMPIPAVLDEVYKALQAGSSRLATIGARTVVDAVILDKVGDLGTFREKLAELERQGFVGRRNREFVAAALETGSAAAHRGIAVDSSDLSRVMDIVESLLESVYILSDAAERLRQNTPNRPPRGKKQ